MNEEDARVNHGAVVTTTSTGQVMNASTSSTLRGRGRVASRLTAAIAFLLAAIVGAYLDWLWWPVYSGLTITLAAAAILLAGGIVTLIGRVSGRTMVRRAALVIVAVGIGLVAGQSLGPSREALLIPSEGTLTLRLDSPVVAVATGPVTCTNVASATEFSVTGDPNLRLDTPDQPFVSIYVNRGDRWRVLRDVPRKDGVLLNIGITGIRVSDSGKPSTVGMQATETSTLESTFGNEGGSIRFANLVTQSGPDFNGQSMDLAGTLEWTCGAVAP